MSRKKTKKQKTVIATSVPVPTAAAAVPASGTQYRLDDLGEKALAHLNACEWDALRSMADLPVEQFIAEDQQEAPAWMARLYWIAVSEGRERRVAYLHEGLRAELNRRLQTSANTIPDFFKHVEFEGYLDSFRYNDEDSLFLYRYLLQVCEKVIDMRWVAQLRDRARRLLLTLERDDDERTDELELPTPESIFAALSSVYSRAEKEQSLTEPHRAWLTILRAELGMLMLEPWDTPASAALLRTLESPAPEDVATYIAAGFGERSTKQLTPVALAFIWELSHTTYGGFGELLARYPNDFGCTLVNGLRLMVESLLCPPEHVDERLRAAVQLFLQDHQSFRPWLGESVLVKTSAGVQEIYIEPLSVYIPKEPYELLLHLFENTPHSHPRSAEIDAFYRIYGAGATFSPLEDEDDADINMPGLAWLCEQSLLFQFMAAENIQGVGGRAYLSLDGIRRAAVQRIDTPDRYFSGDLTEEPLQQADVRGILEVIDRIVPVRDFMTESTEHMWLQVAPDVFRALSLVDGAVRKDVLKYARYCEGDLLDHGRAFVLGYLEQMVGSPTAALRHYLHELDTAKKINQSAVNNAKLLWAKEEDSRVVASFVKMLTEAAATNDRPEEVQALLKGAKARLDVLNKQDQFERTAINRWPSVTAPARKLLGVLSNIQRFKNFGELAKYAGMRADWAEKHYDKLVETGMLLLSKDGYSVNPHIQPMLELESQHSVVGRIVRSQGTSAVKQVFNSQREFTIYQVMVQLCPNHLVFPNSSLQSIMSYEKMKELVDDDDFGYYLRASVDIVVVSSTTYLPMLAIEVDSVWHDTERQQKNDSKKDRLFAVAGIPFMRLRPVGTPSENVIRGQVAEHLDDLIRTLRVDLPGYDQARILLEDLSGASVH